MGACVQCANKNCFVAFHVTCGRRAHLFLKMKNPHGNISDHSYYKAFCDKHVSPDWRKEHLVDTATTEAKEFYRRTMRGRRWADSQQAALSAPVPPQTDLLDGTEDGDPNDPLSAAGNNKRKKLALQKKIWRLPGGAPIVPNFVYTEVEKALSKFAIRKRKEFCMEACKYWSLKREARRGAPLIKRFQAQMEAFTSMEVTRRNFFAMGAAGRPKLDRRVKFAEHLEKDMSIVLGLCEQIQDRERQKLADAEMLSQLVDTMYFPNLPPLRAILEKAQIYDANVPTSKHYFKEGLDALQAKMDERSITSVAAFTVELAKAFSTAIRTADTGDGSRNGDTDSISEHKSQANLQKEKRARGKRIVQMLKPALQDATRMESELGFRTYDVEWREIEAMLKECTEVTPGPVHLAVGSGAACDSQCKPTHALNGSHVSELNRKLDQNEDVEMTDVNDRHQLGGEHLSNGYESTPNGVHAPNSHPIGHPNGPLTIQVGSSEAVDAISGSTNFLIPPLSNSGSTILSTNPDSLTPPRHDKDLLAPISQGGVMWYLQAFDPVGTTLHDERWTGREVLRGMSEELSELDDDAMNDLAEMHDVKANGERPELLEITAAERPRPKPKKRRR
jgi:NuA3 HAT complex component NTO1